MKMTLVTIALAALSITSVASAGNGVERTALSGIDFTLGKGLSDELKNKTVEALESRCGDVVSSADHVILVNVDEEEVRVDQGILDMQYVLSFRVIRDSLPPRMIRVKAFVFDVNTWKPEARIQAVEGMNCQ